MASSWKSGLGEDLLGAGLVWPRSQHRIYSLISQQFLMLQLLMLRAHGKRLPERLCAAGFSGALGPLSGFRGQPGMLPLSRNTTALACVPAFEKAYRQLT